MQGAELQLGQAHQRCAKPVAVFPRSLVSREELPAQPVKTHHNKPRRLGRELLSEKPSDLAEGVALEEPVVQGPALPLGQARQSRVKVGSFIVLLGRLRRVIFVRRRISRQVRPVLRPRS